MTKSTTLSLLIENIYIYTRIYTLYGQKCLLRCVANFWPKLIYSTQRYKKLLKALKPVPREWESKMLVIDKFLWSLVGLAFARLGNISIYKFLCLYVRLLFVIDAHVARLNK